MVKLIFEIIHYLWSYKSYGHFLKWNYVNEWLRYSHQKMNSLQDIYIFIFHIKYWIKYTLSRNYWFFDISTLIFLYKE